MELDCITFQPKEGGERWTATIDKAIASGYDVVLFLDKENSTEDSGLMMEIGINADGSICGQITAHPGYDALALFQCTQDTLTVSDMHGGPDFVVTDKNG